MWVWTTKSTITLLDDFADSVNEALDNNKIAPALLIDTSKTFNTTDHSLVLGQLDR